MKREFYLKENKDEEAPQRGTIKPDFEKSQEFAGAAKWKSG